MADKITIVVIFIADLITHEVEFEVDADTWSDMDHEERKGYAAQRLTEFIDWGYAEKEAAHG